MRILYFLVLLLTCAAAQAALVDRGAGLIYDDVLDVTWLQDANYAKTSGHDSDGLMTWSEAQSWAANLNYYDSVRDVTWDNFRLPAIAGIDPTCSFSPTPAGFNCTASEMGNLYNASSVTSGAPGIFTNVESGRYWYENTSSSNPILAWQFSFEDDFGFQSTSNKELNEHYAWAVLIGDVGAAVVPIPAAVWLFGSALFGLGWFRRKRA